MPPRITVEFLGDSKNLEQTFQRTGTEARRFGRDIDRANTLGSRSFDRLSRSATVTTGRLRGLGAGSTYAGYRIQNLVTNIQSISRESKSADGSVNILLQSLGLFGVVGAGVAATALGLAKGAQALSNLAGGAGAGRALGVGNTGSLAQMKALQTANRFGGQLTLADVAGPISQGLLTAEGLRSQRPRFVSAQAFRLAVAFAKEIERRDKQVPRRREVNPQQGRSTPQFVQPLTAAQQLKVGLANDPDNVAFLRQKIAADRGAISFLTKRRQQNKISNEEFTAVYTAYYADINATTARITGIQQAAASKVAAAARAAAAKRAAALAAAKRAAARRAAERAALFAPSFANERSLREALTFGPGEPGILVADAIASLKESRSKFETPIGLRVAEARAEARDNQPALMSILKRERASAFAALKSGRLSALARIDAWNLIRDINERLKNQADGDVSNFRKVGARALAKGLGLSGAAERTLIARLSQVGPDGMVHGSGSGAFGFRDQQITVYLDGDKVEAKVTKRQQTRKRRNPPQKRGPFTGGL